MKAWLVACRALHSFGSKLNAHIAEQSLFHAILGLLPNYQYARNNPTISSYYTRMRSLFSHPLIILKLRLMQVILCHWTSSKSGISS